MNIEHLIGSMIVGTLLSGTKRSSRAARFLAGGRGSFLNASTLLALGGVAWGVAETLQQQAGARAPAPAGSSGGGGSPPAPPPSLSTPSPLPGVPADQSEAIPSEAERMLRLMVSAARADGELSTAERQTILDHARTAGVESLVAAEIERATPIDAIVAGVSDEKQREDLYVLAYAIVRADESVAGSERIYLAQLASHLGLDDVTVNRLEQETAARIDGHAQA